MEYADKLRELAQEFLDEDGRWVCTMCGACCLRGPYEFRYHPEVKTFKLERGDGGCRFLNARMRCTIYETRPQICRTEVNSPNATDLERAIACAGLKQLMDQEIELGLRSPKGKKWRLPCPSDTSPKE